MSAQDTGRRASDRGRPSSAGPGCGQPTSIGSSRTPARAAAENALPRAAWAALAALSAAASAGPSARGTRTSIRALSCSGGGPGPGGGAATGIGPNTSAPPGSSAPARSSATPAGVPVTLAIRTAGGKRSSVRSRSSRAAAQAGSQRTRASTAATPAAATTTTRPPADPVRAKAAAANHRRSASSAARRSGRVSSAQPSSSSTAPYPPAATGSAPGVLTTSAAVPGTLASTRSRPEITTSTPGKARPSSSAVRRAPARCLTCAGPVGYVNGGADTVPDCRWCGQPAVEWQCAQCAGTRLRAVVVGARRTAEELGRAFPGVDVVISGRDRVLARVPGTAALVVSTPGAEPVAAGGYGAVLLLGGWALLTRPDLRAAEEALRRWFAAAALARTGSAGGRVVVVAAAGVAAVEALVRWDPAWAAARELRERTELRFPPAVRMASVTGTPAGVAELLAGAELPGGAEVLGPIPVAAPPPGPGPPPEQDSARMLVRVPRADGPALAAALKAASAAHAARGSAFSAAARAGVRLDPIEVG